MAQLRRTTAYYREKLHSALKKIRQNKNYGNSKAIERESKNIPCHSRKTKALEKYSVTFINSAYSADGSSIYIFLLGRA